MLDSCFSCLSSCSVALTPGCSLCALLAVVYFTQAAARRRRPARTSSRDLQPFCRRGRNKFQLSSSSSLSGSLSSLCPVENSLHMPWKKVASPSGCLSLYTLKSLATLALTRCFSEKSMPAPRPKKVTGKSGPPGQNCNCCQVKSLADVAKEIIK